MREHIRLLTGEGTTTDTPVNVQRTRVRSHQTDLNGAMYHGAYLDIFDDARIETFRRLGYTYDLVLASGWNLAIRRVECDYYAPARMDDPLETTVTVVECGRATLSCRYVCCCGQARIAVGYVTYVFLTMTGKPRRFPADLKGVIEDHAAILMPVPQMGR